MADNPNSGIPEILASIEAARIRLRARLLKGEDTASLRADLIALDERLNAAEAQHVASTAAESAKAFKAYSTMQAAISADAAARIATRLRDLQPPTKPRSPK